LCSDKLAAISGYVGFDYSDLPLPSIMDPFPDPFPENVSDLAIENLPNDDVYWYVKGKDIGFLHWCFYIAYTV